MLQPCTHSLFPRVVRTVDSQRTYSVLQSDSESASGQKQSAGCRRGVQKGWRGVRHTLGPGKRSRAAIQPRPTHQLLLRCAHAHTQTKKQIYDVHGPEAAREAASRGGGGGGGFHGHPFGGPGAGMTPEELFEFLFTGQAPARRGGGMRFRGGPGFRFHTNFGGASPFADMRAQQRAQRHRRAQHAHQAAGGGGGFFSLLQFLPLLFILFSVLMGGWSSPEFSVRLHDMRV